MPGLRGDADVHAQVRHAGPQLGGAGRRPLRRGHRHVRVGGDAGRGPGGALRASRRRRRSSARTADVGLGDRGQDTQFGDTAGGGADSVMGSRPARRRDERAGPHQQGTGVLCVRCRTSKSGVRPLRHRHDHARSGGRRDPGRAGPAGAWRVRPISGPHGPRHPAVRIARRTDGADRRWQQGRRPTCRRLWAWVHFPDRLAGSEGVLRRTVPRPRT